MRVQELPLSVDSSITRCTTPTLSLSRHCTLITWPPPTTVCLSGATTSTVGGTLSGGPLTISKGAGLGDDTGGLTPSCAGTRKRASGGGIDGTRQPKCRALP